MPFLKRAQALSPTRLAIGTLVFAIVSMFVTCSEGLTGCKNPQYVMVHGHRLKKSLIEETSRASDTIDCTLLCMSRRPQCKSVNYGTSSRTKGKCQLNNSTATCDRSKLVFDEDFDYWEEEMNDDSAYCPAQPNKPKETKETFVANFTNLGASGRFGPSSLGSFYADQDHENMVRVVNGTQYWTVPFTGTYQITAVGASGGYDYSGAAARGRGAYMKGDFELNKGEVIQILVGQEGVENSGYYSAGGGGGTFVVTSSNLPLLIAGGGGGIQYLKARLSNCDASVGTSGKKNECVPSVTDCSNWSGGVNGSGALQADDDDSGGGGGGFYSNGRSSKQFGGKYGRGGEGGRGFLQGAAGGRARWNNVVGGFGGGGGAEGWGGGGGGGGGYSGGASGDNTYSCGGGGGSYNIGRNQENSEGVQANGHGYVVINKLVPDQA